MPLRLHVVIGAGTVWAFVLEEDEDWDGSTYKLRVDIAEYPCSSNVGHLEKSVKTELERMEYAVPDRIRIFKDNPFQEAEVEENNFEIAYRLKPGTKHLRNNVKVTDADRGDEHPYFVLVSRLRKRQPSMDISTSQRVPAAGRQMWMCWHVPAAARL